MKINHNLIKGLAVATTALALAADARAGIFTWSAPVPVTTADATLNQTGTVVGAAGFGTENQLVVLSNGALFDFRTDGSVATATGNGSDFGAFTNDTGNAAFNTILTQFNYNGGPKTITLNNLVPGQEYSVQLFALDRRNGVAATAVANFQDPEDATDISANFQMGDNVSVSATFVAPGTSVNIQENLLNSNNGNINALVVRAIGGSVAPQITTEPQAATIYHGQIANFTAPAIGSGALTWHWQKGNVGGTQFTNLVNGGRIFGATNYSLTISNLITSDTADYQVVVSTGSLSVTSTPAATLTVLGGTPQFNWAGPTPITTADATLNQSGTIVGAEVFGTTETIVTLSNHATVDFKADGSVANISSGGYGNATGAFLGDTGNANFNAVLNQFTFDGGPDTISLNNLFVGQQYSVQVFSLDDRAGAALYRQANFQDPNDQYNISTTFQMGDNVYTIGTFTASSTSVSIQENLLTGGYGNLNALVIRALGVIVAPQITTQPQGVTIDQGLTTSLSAAAAGTAPLSYRWQRGVVGSGVFTNIPVNSRYVGLNSATLTISNLTPGDQADYQVIVANAAGSVTSAPPATLTVLAATPQFVWSVPAAITTADATLAQAGTVVEAATFGTTPAIVVLTNGTSIYFSTNSAVASVTGAGTATGAFSGNTSNTVFNSILNAFNYDNGPKTITVGNLVAGRQYAVQLFALDNRNGLTARQASFQDPNDSYDFSDIFNMGDNVYTLATFTASGPTATLQENLPSSGYGNMNALVVRQLSGLPLAPVIVAEPVTTAVYAGASAQLTVAATGTALNYQWQSAPTGTGSFSNLANGGNVSGATTAQLTITSASAANAADYRVIVSNGSGSVTSSPNATLTIRNTAANLIHRWNFNETSGTVAHDSVGTANGTLVTGTGTSASFNGTGQVVLNNPGLETTGAGSYVSIPGGLVTSLSAVTFELWYNNTGLNNGNPWISFGGPVDPTTLHGTNFINFFARWSGSTTAFQIQSTAGDSGVVTLGPRQQSGTFHWVAVYDPIAGTVSVYLNGNLQASATGIHIPLSTVGTSAGYIGYTAWNQVAGNSDPNLPLGSFSAQYGFNGNGNYPYLNANVDEVRIYDGALNTNAIAATQLLGPNTLLSNTAILSAFNSPGSLTLVWPLVNGGFTLESSPVLSPNPVWSAVPGTKTVVGTNYQLTVSSTNAAAFYRLRQ